MSSLFQIGTSGLITAQANLATAGHNIANASTPGYSRQRVIQEANEAQVFGSGFIGKGVHVATIARVYDEFLVAQVRDLGARQSSSAVLESQIGRLSNLIGDSTSGLQPAITEFFASLHDVAQYPTDAAARSTLLSSAGVLAGRMRDMEGELQRLRKDTNVAVERGIDKTNVIARKIALLNEQIAVASNTGATPNDLLDQRDQLTRELGQLIKVTTNTLADGTINVFMGNGQALVTGSVSYALQAVADPRSSDDVAIALAGAGIGGPIILPYAGIGGGEIFGHLSFRDGALTDAQNGLGRFAQALTTTVNEQHRLGQDKYGALGGDFFAVGAPQCYADTRNTGSGIVTASVVDSSQLVASDYMVRWDGASYSVRRMSDGVTQTFGTLPQTIDGLQIGVTGTPAADDSFTVLAYRNAAADFRAVLTDPNRVAAATPVRSSAAIANLGSGTISAPQVNGPAPDPNLQQTVTITFTGPTTFDVSGVGTGNPSNVGFIAGGTINYNGWSIRIDGVPRAGDTFTVAANVGGIGDSGNARRLAELQTRQVLGGETLSGSLGQMIAQIGNAAHAAEIDNAAQEQLLSAAEQARDSVSGVNLDEEAADLLRYQSAYQAAARFIAVAGSLFDELLNSIR